MLYSTFISGATLAILQVRARILQSLPSGWTFAYFWCSYTPTGPYRSHNPYHCRQECSQESQLWWAQIRRRLRYRRHHLGGLDWPRHHRQPHGHCSAGDVIRFGKQHYTQQKCRCFMARHTPRGSANRSSRGVMPELYRRCEGWGQGALYQDRHRIPPRCPGQAGQRSWTGELRARQLLGRIGHLLVQRCMSGLVLSYYTTSSLLPPC